MNQHFVPRFLIEGFVDETSPGNRGVWVYRASRGKWEKRPTKTTAALEDFYSFVEETGARDDSVEEFFGQFETDAAPVIREMIPQRARMSPPNPQDVFIVFCTLLICRNPSTVESVKKTLAREIIEEMTPIFADREKFQSFRQEIKENTGRELPNFAEPEKVLSGFRISATKAGGLAFSLLMFVHFSKLLGESRVTFLWAPNGCSFITSDSPYAFGATKPGELEQILIPLSPALCAVFHPEFGAEYGHLDATQRDVTDVNDSILSVASEFIVAKAPDVVPNATLEEWARCGPLDRRRMPWRTTT